MKFYRSPLDAGGFEYARVDTGSGRVHYFDDELRIWIGDDSLHAEIVEGGIWSPCSVDEVLDVAHASAQSVPA